MLSDFEGSNEDPEKITSQQLGSNVESRPGATSILNEREVIPDRLAYLRHKYKMQGIPKRVTELLIELWQTNTNTSYNSARHKWQSWPCTRRGCDPTSTSINNVLQFLADQFDLGLQYLLINSLRSAIFMTHTNIGGIPMSQYPLVSHLLQGIFNTCPLLP